MLQQCKSWNGPVTSPEELKGVLRLHSQNAERIVRAELACYRDTCKPEIAYHADLCKLNKITHEDRLINICASLGGQIDQKDVHLPNITEALAISKWNGVVEDSTSEADIEINKIYVAMVGRK